MERTMQKQSMSFYTECATDFFYQNNDHVTGVFNFMNQMRKELVFCDVNLVTNDIEIAAHKMILSAASPYFYAMFTNFEESRQNKVTLREISSEILQTIIEYIYTSEVHITEENVQDLLAATNLLQIIDVRDACLNFLKEQLHPMNSLGIRALADLHDCSCLVEKTDNFILQRFSEVAKSEEFLMLPHADLSRIISSDGLNVSSEEEVFECILTWIKHDVKSRQRYFPTLIQHVRVGFLSEKYFFEVFLKHSLLKDNSQFVTNTLESYVSNGKYCANASLFRRRQPMGSSQLLLVAGGYLSMSSVECYDFSEKRWFKLPDMPIGRRQAAMVVLDKKVYMIGGSDGGQIQSRVDIYDPAVDEWSRSIDMNYKREYLAATTSENCIYAVGGYGNGTALKTIEKFDLQTQNWSVVAAMLTGRFCSGVGVVNNRLYIVGGSDGTNRLSSVECYDLSTNNWIPVNDLPTRRTGVGVGVLNGILYAAGGYDGFERLKAVEAYNPKTGAWTSVADMNIRRWGAAVVTSRTRLYIIGGCDDVSDLKSVDVYNPETNTWTLLAHCLSVGRQFSSAVLIDKPES